MFITGEAILFSCSCQIHVCVKVGNKIIKNCPNKSCSEFECCLAKVQTHCHSSMGLTFNAREFLPITARRVGGAVEMFCDDNLFSQKCPSNGKSGFAAHSRTRETFS